MKQKVRNVKYMLHHKFVMHIFFQICSQKADSDDSGNEEPIAESDFYPSNGEDALQAAQRMVPKVDRLAERLSNLTVPYEREHVPEGLVDSLPPEGIYKRFHSYFSFSCQSYFNCKFKLCIIE